jgi:hypothetical protein
VRKSNLYKALTEAKQKSGESSGSPTLPPSSKKDRRIRKQHKSGGVTAAYSVRTGSGEE